MAQGIVRLAYCRAKFYESLVDIARSVGTLDHSRCSLPQYIKTLLRFRWRVQRKEAAEQPMDIAI